MNRKDAATARRLQADPAGRAIEEAQQRIAAKLAARKDPMDALPTTSVTSSAPPVGEIQRIPANPLGSELRSIAARLLHLRTHLDDDPHDEELRRAVVRLRDLSDGATPRPPQAAGDANDPGDDAGAAHGADKPAAGRTEPPDTTMDVPGEPICGPACDPTKCMPGCALQPDHAHKPSEHANEHAALRQRLADALNAEPRFTFEEVLNAVMAEVRPVLDAKDAEIAQLRTHRDEMRIHHARQLTQHRERAEAAEAQLRDQYGDRT